LWKRDNFTLPFHFPDVFFLHHFQNFCAILDYIGGHYFSGWRTINVSMNKKSLSSFQHVLFLFEFEAYFALEILTRPHTHRTSNSDRNPIIFFAEEVVVVCLFGK
jgi:hypothetical protein